MVTGIHFTPKVRKQGWTLSGPTERPQTQEESISTSQLTQPPQYGDGPSSQAENQLPGQTVPSEQVMGLGTWPEPRTRSVLPRVLPWGTGRTLNEGHAACGHVSMAGFPCDRTASPEATGFPLELSSSRAGAQETPPAPTPGWRVLGACHREKGTRHAEGQHSGQSGQGSFPALQKHEPGIADI